jgi:predicted DNA-binding antitoxin AbrB/MazE fold protein
MSTSIDTIFENGVFRPLKPVAIAENQRVQILLADPSLLQTTNATKDISPVRHSPSPYPDDSSVLDDDDFTYQPVPPKMIGAMQARFVFAGRLKPPVYPEE